MTRQSPPVPAASTTFPAIGVAHLAQQLTEDLLEPRRAYLHHHAPARATHQLRRDLAVGKVRAFEHLLRVSVADLDDGVPLPLVLEPYRSLVAALCGVAHAHAERPALVPLLQRETRAEGALNEVQIALAACPDSPALMERELASAARYEGALDALQDAIRVRRAALRLEHA
jgi:hypothetical protein